MPATGSTDVKRRTFGAAWSALVLTAVACTNGATPIESPSPTLSSLAPTLDDSPTATTPTSPLSTAEPPIDEEVGLDDGTWDHAAVPGSARALVNGWSGGYLAITERSRDGSNAIHVWSIAADGAIDRGFGTAGSTEVIRIRDGSPLVVAGVEKRSSDRSLLVLTTAVEPGASGPGFVHRIDADGRLDAGYRQRQGGGFDVRPEHDARMTLVPDGGARICWTMPGERPSIGMWALRADGSRDESFGADGTRNDIVADSSCAGAETDAYGNVVLASVHHARSGSDPSRVKREVTLLRMRPDGALDESFGPETLREPDRSFDAKLMRIARDGSIVVAGVVTPVHAEGAPLGPDRYEPSGPSELFIARADANGRWIRRFGEDGVVRLPLDLDDEPVRLLSLDPANQRTFLSVDQLIRGDDVHRASLRAIRTVDGSPDPSLDEDGYLRTRSAVVRTIADGRGGFLLFGTRGRHPNLRAVLERSALTGP